MIYATFDENGFPNGFYSEITHGTRLIDGKPNPACKIPAAAVEIDEDQYAELVVNQGFRKFINGEVVEYTPPPAPEPIPDDISRRQFFQQLAVMDIITKAEALAAMKGGAIPAPLQAIIDALPTEDDQFQAQMLIVGAASFNRLHPLAETVRLAMGWTEQQKHDFWREAYRL